MRPDKAFLAQDDLPLVSIITPSYNQGHFIQYTINSIRKQTYPRLEHIIVDGASTDNTLDVIRANEGSYNMRWLSEPDDGMYDAINKGLQLAFGDIIAYLNCDDMYFPWSAASAVQALRDTPLIYGDVVRLDLEAGTTTLASIPPFISAYYRALGFIFQPAVFFRRDVLERMGPFDQQLRYLGDVEYWLRCDKHGIKPKKLWECLAIERMHAGSQNSRLSQKLKEEETRVRQRYASWNTRFTFPYYLFRNLYWRVVFIFLTSPRLPGWRQLKQSGAVTMGWRQYFQQITPRRFKSGASFQPYLRAERIKQLSAAPPDEA